MTIDVPLVDTQTFYYTNYTGGEARLAYQGRLLVLAQTPIPQGAVLSAWVEYDICFMDPSLSTRGLTNTGTASINNLTLKAGQGTDIINPDQSTIQGTAFNVVSVQTPYSVYNVADNSSDAKGSSGITLPAGKYVVDVLTNARSVSTTTASAVQSWAGLYGNIGPKLSRVIVPASWAAAQYLTTATADQSFAAFTGQRTGTFTNPSSNIFRYLLDVSVGGATLLLSLGAPGVAPTDIIFGTPPRFTINQLTEKAFSLLNI